MELITLGLYQRLRVRCEWVERGVIPSLLRSARARDSPSGNLLFYSHCTLLKIPQNFHK